MNDKLIFIPLLAQVLLTAIVFFRMYLTRVNEMKRKRIHPQKIATNATAAQNLTDSCNVAENFSNQFEMPVLFYVIIISLYVTGLSSEVYLIMASVFVLLRYVHSFIHAGYNKVMHRFYAYAAGSLILWAMWLLFAIDLFKWIS